VYSREEVLRRLHQAIILEDVTIADVSEELDLVHVLGAKEDWEALRKLDGMPAQRYGRSGYDVGFPRSRSEEVAATLLEPFSFVSDHTAEILRVEAGVPRYGVDITPKTLAMEMGAAFVASRVSFSKGCYTGQEINERIHSRGHTNRVWYGIRTSELVAPGAETTPAGVVTSSVVSPSFGPIAAVMGRLPAASTVSVRTPHGMEQAEAFEIPILGSAEV
jgi:folate-binding protein YgfZ